MSVAEFEGCRFHYRGTITRAVDGDTVIVSLDLGLRTYRDVSLRIAGINAPELNSGTPEDRELGKAARDFVSGYVGQPVYVVTYKDHKSFDRYIGSLYLPRNGELLDLADLIVGAGHAVRV